MNNKVILLSIVAVILSFIGGFLLANSINRSEINSLRAELESTRAAQKSGTDQASENLLSDEEIKSKIAAADANPENFTYQKNLGISLGKYGSITKNAALLGEAERLLDRAARIAPDDTDVMIGQGNAAFDIGYFNKDNAAFQRARDFYEKALAKKPDNIDVRTDLGITYFLEDPPRDDKAIAEFKKSLAVDPKHEKTLEFIIQALVRQQNRAEAEKYLEKLRQVDPNSEALPGLADQVAGKSDGAGK
jgi:tetratricopeptide (TPR) repeat protein